MSLSCVVAMRRERKKKDKKINEVERTWLEDDKKNEKKKKKRKRKKRKEDYLLKSNLVWRDFFGGRKGVSFNKAQSVTLESGTRSG